MNEKSEGPKPRQRDLYIASGAAAVALVIGWLVARYFVTGAIYFFKDTATIQFPMSIKNAMLFEYWRTYILLGGMLLIAVAVVSRQKWIAYSILSLSLLWAIGSWAAISSFRQELNAKIDAYDLELVDKYLRVKDEWAQSKGDIAANEKFLKANEHNFHKNLGFALMRNDRRAPSRFVLHALLGVGAPLDYTIDTNEIQRLAEFKIPTFQRDRLSATQIALWEIYFWWTKNSHNYESFPLMEEWFKSDFAQKTVLPMYEKMRTSPETPAQIGK